MSRAAVRVGAILFAIGAVAAAANALWELPSLIPFLAKAALGLGAFLGLGTALARRWLGIDRADALLGSVALLVITAAIALAIGEGMVRFAFRDITTTGDFTSWFAMRWRAEVEHNALGYREREIVLPKPEGTYRIAVVGDSFAYGQGIPREARFSDRLEAALNDGAGAGRVYEVLNFGRPGTATEDQIEMLRDAVLDTDPDFVLLQWYRNDVEGPSLEGRPLPQRFLPSDYLERVLHVHSALFYVVTLAWNQLRAAFNGEDAYADYMRERFADPESPDSLAAGARLDEFVSLAQARGVPVGIVTFPVLFAGDEFGYLRDRVMAFCEARALPCLDLEPAFAEHGDRRALWVDRFDSHPGPEANAIAAEQIERRFGPLWRSAQASAAEGAHHGG